MNILKVKISRKNNATTREVLSVELPILEELFPGGENESDVEVLSERKASKEDIARFLIRSELPGEEQDEMPDVKLAFMNLSARYETKDGQAALKAVYPSENAFRRAWTQANSTKAAA